MTDNISKGPKDDGGFFDKNGTLQTFVDTMNSLKSANATQRLGGLGQIVAYILSLI